jgi:hypothetical protein
VPFRDLWKRVEAGKKQGVLLDFLNAYFSQNQVAAAPLEELRPLAACDYCLVTRLRKYETIIGFDRQKKKKLFIEGMLIDWHTGTPVWEFVSSSLTAGRYEAEMANQDQLLRDIWTHVAERLPQQRDKNLQAEQKENW